MSTWFPWAIGSAVFAALTAVLLKVGVKDADPDIANLVRTFIIALALAIYVGLTGKWSGSFSLSQSTLTYLTLSACATAASWVCYFRAIKAGDASKVDPIDKLSVLLVAVFAVCFLGEKPLLRDWLAIILIGAGAVILGLKK